MEAVGNNDTQMTRVESFCEKFNIDEDGKTELVELFNECMVSVAMGIMNLPGVQDKFTSVKTKSPKAKATPKAKVDKIKCSGQTKSGTDCRNRALDGESFCKTHLPKKPELIIEPTPDSAECNAICANGKNCKQKGRMIQPDGSDYKYCFKHSKNWKKFEGDSGASVGVESDSEPVKLTKEENEERIANNLSESEYEESVSDYESRESMAKDKLSPDEMVNWVKNNQIVVEDVKKVELKVKEPEVVVKQKRPTWMKKAQDAEEKRKAAIKKHDDEMLA
jgi:hypothetical protein